MTLTYKDEERIREIVKDEIEDKIQFLPTKDEFYNAMDRVMRELKSIREEVAIISDTKTRIEDHEECICPVPLLRREFSLT